MEPLLSVCLITYNHVKYIEQAIEGVLMQKVNFPFELIIADDFSTDGTREIVEACQKKYPDLVKLILQKNNVGPAKNWIDLITYPQSKYIAYFEGDDYWTDPLKLQKQVDFLEVNPEYTVCFTNSTYYETAINKQYVPESFERLLNGVSHYIIDLNSYYNNFATPTLTVVFVAKKLFSVEIKGIKYLNDAVMFFILLSQGKGALLNFNSAVYRIHPTGLWSGINDYKKKLNIFYALDSGIKAIPDLKSCDHLTSWHKWNLTQAYYLLSEIFLVKDIKQYTFLLFKVLKYQDRTEKKKAMKTYFKTIFSFK